MIEETLNQMLVQFTRIADAVEAINLKTGASNGASTAFETLQALNDRQETSEASTTSEVPDTDLKPEEEQKTNPMAEALAIRKAPNKKLNEEAELTSLREAKNKREKEEEAAAKAELPQGGIARPVTHETIRIYVRKVYKEAEGRQDLVAKKERKDAFLGLLAKGGFASIDQVPAEALEEFAQQVEFLF